MLLLLLLLLLLVLSASHESILQRQSCHAGRNPGATRTARGRTRRRGPTVSRRPLHRLPLPPVALVVLLRVLAEIATASDRSGHAPGVRSPLAGACGLAGPTRRPPPASVAAFRYGAPSCRLLRLMVVAPNVASESLLLLFELVRPVGKARREFHVLLLLRS